jgi:hypothetical protein
MVNRVEGRIYTMSCDGHDKVYVATFEKGRVLWICRKCLQSGGEVDDDDPTRVFDTEQYFQLLTEFNEAARQRARSTGQAS